MKTLNFTAGRTIRRLKCMRYLFVAVAASLPSLSFAQENVARPATTDKASRQLVSNFLTVTGGKAAHDKLINVVATGTLEEAGKVKRFELIELQDGKRRLKTSWRKSGREYEEVQVFDGAGTWVQALQPEKKHPRDVTGLNATHFLQHRWLIQPLVLPSVASFTFKYQGKSRVGGRMCHLVVGYGKRNERTWFYFDEEKFLLLRWGGFGQIGGVREYLDYRASSFKSAGGVLMPTSIDLLAENSAFGTIRFDSILANQPVDMSLFEKPKNMTPTLRQRSVTAN